MEIETHNTICNMGVHYTLLAVVLCDIRRGVHELGMITKRKRTPQTSYINLLPRMDRAAFTSL